MYHVNDINYSSMPHALCCGDDVCVCVCVGECVCVETLCVCVCVWRGWGGAVCMYACFMCVCAGVSRSRINNREIMSLRQAKKERRPPPISAESRHLASTNYFSLHLNRAGYRRHRNMFLMRLILHGAAVRAHGVSLLMECH